MSAVPRELTKHPSVQTYPALTSYHINLDMRLSLQTQVLVCIAHEEALYDLWPWCSAHRGSTAGHAGQSVAYAMSSFGFLDNKHRCLCKLAPAVTCYVPMVQCT